MGWLQCGWQHYWLICTADVLCLLMQKHLNLVPEAFLFLSVFIYPTAASWQHETERGHAHLTYGVCVFKSLEKRVVVVNSHLYYSFMSTDFNQSPLMHCTLTHVAHKEEMFSEKFP